MASSPAAGIEALLADPRFQNLDDEAKARIRIRFFEKKVQGSPEYQRALPSQKRTLEAEAIGFDPGDDVPVAGGPGAAMAAPMPQRTPLPGPMPTPGAAAPPTAQEGEGVLRSMLKPGGMMSPKVQGMMGGGMIGTAMGGPPGGLLGAGIGGGLGRAYEWMTEPGEAPADLSSAVSDFGQTATQGMKAEALGQAGGAAMSSVGQFARRPFGRLTQGQRGFLDEATDLGLNPRASQIRNSPRMAKAEEVAGTVAFGAKEVEQRIAAEETSRRAVLTRMAEEASPGAARDYETVSKSLRKGFEQQNEVTRQAASDLFDRSKDVVESAAPGGVYATPSLQRSAAKVIGTESPLAPFSTGALPKAHGILNQFGEPAGVKLPPGRTHEAVSSTTAEQLRMAGYDPEKVYTFPELLSLTQRLGRAVMGTKDYVARAELTHMWRAANDDLIEAANTAGAPQAIPMLEAAKSYYKANIIDVFRNRKIIRTMIAQDPSESVATLLRPGVTVEQVRRVKRAAGDKPFSELQGAWYEDLARRSTNTAGDFDAKALLGGLAEYKDRAVLKELAGKQYVDLAKFERVLQRMTRNEVSSNKNSLAFAQAAALGSAVMSLVGFGSMKGAATGVAISATPGLFGKLMYSPGGIRWLTVGLSARPGSNAFVKAASKLAAIANQTVPRAAGAAYARPSREGDSGFSLSRGLGLTE